MPALPASPFGGPKTAKTLCRYFAGELGGLTSALLLSFSAGALA